MRFSPPEFHESLGRPAEVQGSSDRAFGFIMATAFAVISALSYLLDATHWPLWSGLAAALALCAWLQPKLLAPFNKLWLQLGLLLHRLATPVIMGLVFFFILTPTGLVLRAMRRRPLELGFDQEKQSYWGTLSKKPGQALPTAKQY